METLTYSAVAVTLGLVVVRPRIGPRFRLTPAVTALAGVAVLAAFGSVRLADLAWTARTMWRPLLGIVSIMVMTGVARRAGVLESVADLVFARAAGSSVRLFGYVFGFGALTAAVLNNDSAILLLTPLVIDASKKRSPALVVPLAFAVFLSAGIAPLVVSNPMNMVVASVAGIGFNEYAAHMIMPSLAGGIVTFVAARLLFRKTLAASRPRDGEEENRGLDAKQRLILAALAGVVLAYPVVSWFGGPVWMVAAAGALLLLALGTRSGQSPVAVLKNEIHVGVLVFLVAALLLSSGLRNVGLVARLADVYAGASIMKIGVVSAMGSAVLNNHPMANLNMMALEGAGHRSVLAALVGGDLGPRLFPMGSLAGLLWLEMLRRAQVQVSVRQFVTVGAIATVPALVVSLLLL